MEVQALKDNLKQFTGSQTVCRYSPNLLPHILLTEGVKFLAETTGAFWMMDTIGYKLREISDYFVVIHVVVQNRSAVMRFTDGNETEYFAQHIDYTDFPLEEVKLYASRSDDRTWVVMLPSEY